MTQQSRPSRSLLVFLFVFVAACALLMRASLEHTRKVLERIEEAQASRSVPLPNGAILVEPFTSPEMCRTIPVRPAEIPSTAH